MRLIDADAQMDDYFRRVARHDVSEFAATHCFPYWIMHEVITQAPTVCVTALTTLNALRDAAYRDALERGLWRPDDTPMDGAQMIRAKAMELIYMTDEDRPMTYENALADVVVGALSFAGKFGVDLDGAVRRKMKNDKGCAQGRGKE